MIRAGSAAATAAAPDARGNGPASATETGRDSASASMNRADRYIFRQLFWAFVLVAISLTCVVWLTQSLRYVEMIVNRGLSAPVFIYFTMLLLPTFFALILPIALFTGLMFTFNKMIMDNEMVVFRASGFSHVDLARPVLILAGIVTVVGYAMTLYFIPASFRAFKDLQYQIRNTYSSVLLQEGVFSTFIPGVTVYVRARNDAGELQGILIHDGREPAHAVTLMAERGAIVAGTDGPRIVMGNGSRQEVSSKDGRLSLLYFDRYTFELSGLSKSDPLRWREPRERYLHELFLPESVREKTWGFQELRMEGHHRLASPLLGIAFVLVGMAALLGGQFNRRGQGRRIVAAVVVVVAIEAAMLGVKSMGRKIPELEPVMYLVPLIPIAVALYLLAGRSRFVRRIPAHVSDA